ncbi:TIGR03943 family putative permease subunit [Bifidobacterium sp.]|jgi:putative membrane protein|uniref:TIGR03943 family putative permease subunit n=1 Tax=Bifidobacterium sp. TaxID=41200 RepID=UPI0025C32E46|nr:TIGR03943 family protein [Bifidobacterium sp.]MCH4209239.1 TIGR03943 family protein [Bifidobacterium sp.]MCI1224650.1 TIGR03943 family protein [Bifidobacterium sp.]
MMASSATGTAAGQHTKPNAIDRVEGFVLFAFAVSIAAFVMTGRFIAFVTPRTVPYLWFAAAVLLIFAVTAWLGVFRCTGASLANVLVVGLLPTLLLSLPFDSGGAALTGTNRAIAINSSASAKLPGLNVAAKTITIRDDDFGSWFDRIDRNADQYVGYTIIVEGSVSHDSSLNASQFSVSRMLMTCCVLDMTPFGFVVDTSSNSTSSPTTMPKDNTWVRVTGTLAKGRVGTASHGYNGLILQAKSIQTKDESPNGYFYR